ncbi:MAG: hypothetical protein JSS70_07750 [Bacteroidetes bacterium]|nr:hypothetical protein [Bacteroidota bacterium]
MNQFYHTIRDYLEEFIFSFSKNRKLALQYLACIIAATLYLGMICFIGKNKDTGFFLKALQMFAFLFAGIFHLFLLNKKISIEQLQFSGEGIVYSLFLSVVVCITLLVFYLFTDNSMAIMAIVSGLAFVLPHVFLHLWFLYKNIPPKEYPVWTHPSHTKDINELLIPEIITFKFLLAEGKNDTAKKQFYKTIPVEAKLGKVFYSVLENIGKNGITTFADKDEHGNPYAWEFYSISLNGLIKKRLEPEDTLSDNGIKNNSIVHVLRLQQEVKLVTDSIRYTTVSRNSKHSQVADKELAGI